MSDGEGNGNSQTENPWTQSPEEYLRIVHTALVNQLNAYGVVLTLVAGGMYAAILQPPGSFDDNGHIRPYKLTACYLLFSSLSFLLACTGLFAVIVGSAGLYHPLFFPVPQNQRRSGLEVHPGFDTISTLESIIYDNLGRVRRLKTYLGFSMALAVISYMCGAFAILGPQNRNWWMAGGTIAVSTAVLAFEAVITGIGPALPDGILARLQQIIH